MTTPPSSLPSPAPSSGSSQPATKPPTFSSIAAANQPNRASSPSGTTSPSAASQTTGATGDGAPTPDVSSEGFSEDAQHHTPQNTSSAAPGAPGFSGHSAAFLPQVTASPPPHAPPYVPPAQHAMAPDPIHTLSPLTPQAGSVWGPGWRPGPPGAPGSAYGPPSAYPRGAPNGHPTHQLPPNPLEAYGAPGSRQSMTSTPGAGPIGPVNGSQGGRSSSQTGEPRDRRRDRHRDEEGRERDDEEVISTIFVVGFPDDMSEREFQNIFTFAQGFEAATLKFPSGTARREPAAAAALLAELQHLAANQNNMGGVPPPMMTPDHQEQPIDESFAAAMNFGTQSSTASNTPSAAMSLTPSAPTGATLGATAIPSSIPPRRQTIGFARFKTRADALAARDHLQGRRIDPLTGATLKAEMAKKNLHTKRGAGGDDLVGLLLRSGRLTQLVTQQQAQVQAQALMSAGGLPPPSAGPHTGTAQSAKEAWDAWPAPTPTNAEGKGDKLAAPQPGGSANSNTSGSPPMSVKSPSARPTDSKALLALAEEADELEGWSVGSVGMAGMPLDYPTSASSSGRSAGGPMSAGGAMATTPSALHGPQHGAIGGGFGGYNQHGFSGSGLGFGAGGQDGALDPRSLGIGNMNPADQNPPINTLYIGNLPAISPPTHPPNFLEESLRALFHRRPGFKRMSFRQKINGPMCFVEFEDIPFATQAMRDLYGNTLNGLVKGGIRLSYSKNSLGQRGNSHQQAMNSSMFGGIAHTVALAGMSSAPTNQMQHGGQGGYGGGLAVSQPVPIGPPSNSGSASGRPSDAPASSLSPTAQPFNAPLPPTSPRSQRFYERQPPSAGPPGSAPGSVQSQSSLGTGKTDPSAAFNSFTPTATTPGGQFSPVSSPIRTPASLGWVSSSTGNAATSGTFGAFDAFAMPHHSLGSLNGAASAWGASSSSTNTPS